MNNTTTTVQYIPRVSAHILPAVATALTSKSSQVRLAAASLSVSLCQGGAPVWDAFIRIGCLTALKELFRLSDEQENLLALKIIAAMSHQEHQRFYIRSTITMDPIVLLSLSPNTEISSTAQSILTLFNHKQVWANVPTVDPYTNLTCGRAARVVANNPNISSKYKIQSVQRGEQESAAKQLTATTQYPFKADYSETSVDP
eukprot:c2085_g1_i2.p1 GENE.c2085_g1_i2~~c2085_g1_i2.p1  ORF type:complete len:201 (+),score=46.96 c2085_g1_i2:503-1105(+)